MGRATEITYEKVAEVADAIRATGGNPTTRGVREKLGSGSMGTITQLMQRWRDENRQAKVEIVLPTGLQRALLDIIAQEQAAARVTLEGELANLQQEVADLADDNERQEADREMLVATLAERDFAVSALEDRGSRLANELAAVREAEQQARSAVEAVRVELAKAELKLESLPQLQGVLDNARADIERERERRIEAEQRAAVLAAQLAAATATAGALSQEMLLRGDRRAPRQQRLTS